MPDEFADRSDVVRNVPNDDDVRGVVRGDRPAGRHEGDLRIRAGGAVVTGPGRLPCYALPVPLSGFGRTMLAADQVHDVGRLDVVDLDVRGLEWSQLQFSLSGPQPRATFRFQTFGRRDRHDVTRFDLLQTVRMQHHGQRLVPRYFDQA